MKNNRNLFLLLLPIILLQACTALKFVPSDEQLYTGAKVVLSKNQNQAFAKKAKQEAADIIRPKPNSTFLGSRPKLWLFYKTERYEKGWKHWLNKKLSETPVYFSKVNAELVSKAVDTRLYNLGYFDAFSSYQLLVDSQTISLIYNVTVNKAYTIEQLVFIKGTDNITNTIASLTEKSLIKLHTTYSLDMLRNERNRIDDILKTQGYYYFNQDFIQFKIDTTLGNRGVKVSYQLKNETPLESKEVFVIKNVNVYADYVLGKIMTRSAKRIIDSINYYSSINYIKPDPIIQSIFIKKGSAYNRTLHDQTLSRLNNLGVYKFVTIKFSKSDSILHLLTADILLTPHPQKSLASEVQGVSKSNNFIGPGINFSYRDRNALHGAELLILKLRTSFETQFNGPFQGQYTFELNPSIELYIPRFLLPFKVKTNSGFVPRTKFTLDGNYLSRVNYYNVNSLKLTYGYKWKPNLPVDHDFTLFSVNYFNIHNQSLAFSSLLQGNPTLALRYEKQFIAGLGHSFYWNEQVFEQRTKPKYVNVNIELAGNILSTINQLGGKQLNPDNPLEILGVKYAQFIRSDFDVRQYIKLDKKKQSVIVARLFAGWGLPFGNARTVPFIKQYFSGGAYSLRGFPVFSVGPGTYAPPDSLRNLYFVQQGGEIKLEANTEYRFAINRLLKGAFFADAGNTWLNKDNSDIPGGKFLWSEFYKQLAVSVGTGLRLDVQFFVFRLDLGIPIRKPWLPDGSRWVFDQFDLKNSRWRSNNLIFNLAFGYPF